MNRACIVFLVDALGWEILESSRVEFPFLKEKKRLKTVLGYSSAAIPSLLSGKLPAETGHWAMYFHKPDGSTFSPTRFLNWLPERIKRGRFSSSFLRWLVESRAGIDGYYSMYEVPFRYLRYFDLCERKNIFKPGGLNLCSGLFDALLENGVSSRVWDWRTDEGENMRDFTRELSDGRTNFFFYYTAELDAIIHRSGTKSAEAAEKIKLLSAGFSEAVDIASSRYDDVHAFVLSDHGMIDTVSTLDLSPVLDSVKFRTPEDYLVFLDSTMARFWFFNRKARDEVLGKLSGLQGGRLLPAEEMRELGVVFPDGRFGEHVFLTSPGTLILPSFMGRKAPRAMHGFHPGDPWSDAMIGSNRVLPVMDSILDFHALVRDEISWLKGGGEG